MKPQQHVRAAFEPIGTQVFVRDFVQRPGRAAHLAIIADQPEFILS